MVSINKTEAKPSEKFIWYAIVELNLMIREFVLDALNLFLKILRFGAILTFAPLASLLKTVRL